jgi:hypothetical protein
MKRNSSTSRLVRILIAALACTSTAFAQKGLFRAVADGYFSAGNTEGSRRTLCHEPTSIHCNYSLFGGCDLVRCADVRATDA